LRHGWRRKIIGIDLGTTFSVAVVERSKPKVMVNKGGNRLTPSIVPFTDKGKTLVGEPTAASLACGQDKKNAQRHSFWRPDRRVPWNLWISDGGNR